MLSRLIFNLLSRFLLIFILVTGGVSHFAAYGETVLRRGNSGEPVSLDPHSSPTFETHQILIDLFEGLVADGIDGETVPGVAERWEVLESGRVYLFHLREAKWSNGDPLTAEDFVYSLRRALDPKTGAEQAFVLAPIYNGEAILAGKMPPHTLGVEAVNKHTLKITLSQPVSYFIKILHHSAAMPVHRATIEKYGKQWTKPQHMVSNGAYTLEAWSPHLKVVLKKSATYWDRDSVSVDKVAYYPIDDDSTEFKMYLAGELDCTATIPLMLQPWIRKNMAAEFFTSPKPAVYYYGIKINHPLFKNNLKLRQALSLALDREAICEKIMRGSGIPAYNFTPQGLAGYVPPSLPFATWPMEKKILEAQKLFREAGFSETNPPSIALCYNSYEAHKKIAIAVASMWKKAFNIDTKLINEEWKVYIQSIRTGKDTQIFRMSMATDYNSPHTFLTPYISTSALNDTGYTDKTFDEKVQKSQHALNQEESYKYLREAEEIFLNAHTVMPLFHHTAARLVKPYVKGYQVSAHRTYIPQSI